MATILIFPLLWKLEGIWFSIVAAEAMALEITLLFLYGKRNRYHYLYPYESGTAGNDGSASVWLFSSYGE